MSTRLPASIILLSGLAAAQGAALAAEPARGLYGQIAGGGNFAREADVQTSGTAQEFEDGGIGSISLGYASRSGWRPELEYALRQNDAENAATGNVEENGNVEANGAMANLWYDVPAFAAAPRLRPFIGGGAGRAELSVEDFATAGAAGEPEQNVTAYQAGAGLNYGATRNLVLSLGYRFFETEKVRFADATAGTPAFGLDPGSPATPAVDDRYRSDGVLAGLRYVFGGREQRPVAAAPARAEVASLETVVLRPVNFQFDRAELTEPSKRTLDEIAARLNARPDLKVTIQGYTDDRGTERYNEQLGQRRAQAVRDYLANKGIQPQRVEIASGGEAQPVADNATPDGRAHNRRAEVSAQDTRPQNMRIVIEGPTDESVEAAKEDN